MQVMALKSQDVLVVLKLVADGEQVLPYAQLAEDLGMSVSEVHAAVRRLQAGDLVAPDERRVNRKALFDFVIHGLRHVFPAKEQDPARGISTAWAAPALRGLVSGSTESEPVWPHPDGSVRGPGVMPLYKSAPGAALKNSQLYDLLALVDAVRIGRARERRIASRELEKRIMGDG